MVNRNTIGPLKGLELSNYILTLLNEENMEGNLNSARDPKAVKVRSNNSNSKWLKLTATSGRNPIWYKSMTLISYLTKPTKGKNGLKKEGIVLMRTMSSLGAGKDSISFKDSPGKYALDIVPKYASCLVSEFYDTCHSLNQNELLPDEFIVIADKFLQLETSRENALNYARVIWAENFKTIKSKFSKIVDPTEEEIMQMALDGIDKLTKKQLNVSTILRNTKEITKDTDEFIKTILTTNIEKINYVSKSKGIYNAFLDEKTISRMITRSIQVAFPEATKTYRVVNSAIKKGTKTAKKL